MTMARVLPEQHRFRVQNAALAAVLGIDGDLDGDPIERLYHNAALQRRNAGESVAPQLF
jgi:hypothetical protein